MKEKECINCAFCKDETCDFFASQWYGKWVRHGNCEYFHSPTGTTIKESVGERGQNMIVGFAMILNAMWGNSFSVDDFLNKDSAVLDAYEAYRKSIDNTK